jgi:hypothetical protein
MELIKVKLVELLKFKINSYYSGKAFLGWPNVGGGQKWVTDVNGSMPAI